LTFTKRDDIITADIIQVYQYRY